MNNNPSALEHVMPLDPELDLDPVQTTTRIVRSKLVPIGMLHQSGAQSAFRAMALSGELREHDEHTRNCLDALKSYTDTLVALNASDRNAARNDGMEQLSEVTRFYSLNPSLVSDPARAFICEMAAADAIAHALEGIDDIDMEDAFERA